MNRPLPLSIPFIIFFFPPKFCFVFFYGFQQDSRGRAFLAPGTLFFPFYEISPILLVVPGARPRRAMTFRALSVCQIFPESFSCRNLFFQSTPEGYDTFFENHCPFLILCQQIPLDFSLRLRADGFLHTGAATLLPGP